MYQHPYLDRDALLSALAYLAGALPCRVEGIALAAPDGRPIIQYLAPHEPRQIAAILRMAERTGADTGDGFQYCFVMGSDHANVAMRLNDSTLLWMTVSGVESLDGVLSGIREGIRPLLVVLGQPGA